MVTLAGAGSFLQSHRIVIADQAPRPSGTVEPLRQRVTGLWSLVLANRSFVRYELRSLAYTVAVGLSLPILPLFYVHELSAPDAWIGAIGAAQSAGGVLGYVAARQLARRRGPTMTLLPSMLVMAAAPAILSTTGWLPAAAIIAFVVGLASAGVQLAMFDQLMRRVPIDQGVTFSSVDQSVQNFALVLAPNIGGVIALALGARTALLAVALMGAIAFALFAWNARPGVLTGTRAVTERERDQVEAPT